MSIHDFFSSPFLPFYLFTIDVKVLYCADEAHALKLSLDPRTASVTKCVSYCNPNASIYALRFTILVLDILQLISVVFCNLHVIVSIVCIGLSIPNEYMASGV